MKNLWIGVTALLLAACGGEGSRGGESATERAETVADAVGAAKVVEITESNDPNDLLGRPDGYESAAVIYDDRVECSDLGLACGATVEAFDSEAAAKERSRYILGLLEDAPMLGSEYHRIDGRLLLRVSGELAPSEAGDYERAFSG